MMYAFSPLHEPSYFPELDTEQDLLTAHLDDGAAKVLALETSERLQVVKALDAATNVHRMTLYRIEGIFDVYIEILGINHTRYGDSVDFDDYGYRCDNGDKVVLTLEEVTRAELRVLNPEEALRRERNVKQIMGLVDDLIEQFKTK